jgi:hypothetical protein
MWIVTFMEKSMRQTSRFDKQRTPSPQRTTQGRQGASGIAATKVKMDGKSGSGIRGRNKTANSSPYSPARHSPAKSSRKCVILADCNAWNTKNRPHASVFAPALPRKRSGFAYFEYFAVQKLFSLSLWSKKFLNSLQCSVLQQILKKITLF